MPEIKSQFAKALALALAILIPGTLIAETVKVPFGTRVFIQLDQRVTSKKKHNRPGSFIHAHVWRDVVVNGKTVVTAGTPVMVQIGEIKGAKVAGIKGHVELKALQVLAVDGGDLMLTGGYDQSGKSLMALSITLAAVIFVPLIFLKGKQAKLESGTVFDAMVSQPTEVQIEDSAPFKISIGHTAPLNVEVRYKELEGTSEKDMKTLPLQLMVEGNVIDAARVVSVNEKPIAPIPITGFAATPCEEGFTCVDAEVNIKALGKHFSKGFNRFTVQVGEFTDEVMLDVEL
jgi:hypothetical protein